MKKSRLPERVTLPPELLDRRKLLLIAADPRSRRELEAAVEEAREIVEIQEHNLEQSRIGLNNMLGALAVTSRRWEVEA